MIAVAAALLLSTFISAWQAVRANAKAATAWKARQTETQLREQAQASERRAWVATAEAHSIVRFLGDWMIGASRPANQMGGLRKDVTLREAIDSAEAVVATAFPNKPLTEAIVRTLFGKTYADLGESGAAIHQLELAAQLTRATLGDEHIDTLSSINNLAVVCARFGQFDKALSYFEETHGQLQRLVDPNHPELLMSMHNLAGVYQNVGRLDEAISLLEETLRRQQTTFGPDHPLSLMTITNLAVVHDMAKDYAQAETLFRKSLSLQQRADGQQRGLMLDTQAFLGRTLLHQQKHAEAVVVLLACTEESQNVQPNFWQTYYYQTLLGDALHRKAFNLRPDEQSAADNTLAKAEVLLRKGCEGMLAREDTMFAQHKPLIAEAVENLITLYEQRARPEDAARWRGKLEARNSPEKPTKCGL